MSLFKRRNSAASELVDKIEKSTDAGVKNLMRNHDFNYISGYDPKQDGDDPRWGRIDVKCAVCNEKRRIGASIEEVNSTGGCIRSGGLKPVRQDFISVGGAVEYFKDVLPSGKILTLSAGNMGYHENDPEDVRLITMYGHQPLDI
jgi:hypothetical protein